MIGLMGAKQRSLFSGGPARREPMRSLAEKPDNVFTNPVTGQSVALPGLVAGYGGGTFNPDGSVATLPDSVRDTGQMPAASAIGWNPQNDNLPMPDASTSGGPTFSPSPRTSGMFGSIRSQPMNDRPAPPMLPDSSHGATAMGVLLPAGPQRRFTQPFDYDGALASMLPPTHKQTTLGKIANIALPALMALGGNQAGANAFIASRNSQRQAEERQRLLAQSTIARWRHEDAARQQQADLTASNPFTIGRDRLQYDPQTGETTTLYDGAEPFEEYAQTMGYEPGSEDYFKAVEDYVLRGDGPTALGRKQSLDDHRTANDRSLEAYRYGNRLGLEGVRQRNRIETRGTPTYRDTHPAAGRGKAAPTATGPNGEKVTWNGSAWVPTH